MERAVLMILVLLVSACEKTGMDRYVGYWQRQDTKKIVIYEIKKENDNYFIEGDLMNGDNSVTEHLIPSEENDKLMVNTSLGNVPLLLSKDGDRLFVGKQNFLRIDTSTKDKIVKHEEKCRDLSIEHRKEIAEKKKQFRPEDYFTKPVYKELVVINEKYFILFDELQKDIKCNNPPRF